MAAVKEKDAIEGRLGSLESAIQEIKAGQDQLKSAIDSVGSSTSTVTFLSILAIVLALVALYFIFKPPKKRF